MAWCHKPLPWHTRSAREPRPSSRSTRPIQTLVAQRSARSPWPKAAGLSSRHLHCGLDRSVKLHVQIFLQLHELMQLLLERVHCEEEFHSAYENGKLDGNE